LGLVLVVLLPVVAGAGHEHPEKWYQERWCAEKGGEVEVVLPDRTRCDCLTDGNAVELDFGTEWVGAISGALYYLIQIRKHARMVLILEKPTDQCWIRLNTVIEHFGLPIDMWETDPLSFFSIVGYEAKIEGGNLEVKFLRTTQFLLI
jgi:hypothetical protein